MACVSRATNIIHIIALAWDGLLLVFTATLLATLVCCLWLIAKQLYRWCFVYTTATRSVTLIIKIFNLSMGYNVSIIIIYFVSCLICLQKPHSAMFYEQSYDGKQRPADLTTYANLPVGGPPVKINTLQVQPTLDKPGEVHTFTKNGNTENNRGRQGVISEPDFRDSDVTDQVLAHSVNPNTKQRLDQTPGHCVPRESNAITNHPSRIDFNPGATKNRKIHSRQCAGQHSGTVTHYDVLRLQGCRKKGKYAIVQPDTSIKMKTDIETLPSVDAMHGTGEFKVRMGNVQTPLRDTTDQTSLQYNDILKRLGRIEELQHTQTIGEIQVCGYMVFC